MRVEEITLLRWVDLTEDDRRMMANRSDRR